MDKKALLARWIQACPKGVVSELSGLNPMAGHELEDAAAKIWFAERVVGFLNELESR